MSLESKRQTPPETPEELFTQVIAAATPEVLKLWEQGDRFIGKEGLTCPDELHFDPKVGRSFYQCQPHFWQCYWQGGVKSDPTIKVELYGETYHIKAKQSFEAIGAYSEKRRYYQLFNQNNEALNLQYGYIVELEVIELAGFSQPLILNDSCRDTFLPERIYGYGNGFTWDNFGRKIFIDRFYVSTQQVNEWYLLTNQEHKIKKDRKLWGLPAWLDLEEQKNYCAYFGKRLLEAKLFDAASMTPADLKNPMPERILKPKTPWHRDISKTFFGIARINPDYQLTPLDCQLAQVEGCTHRLYTTDSVSWMGMNYALGFYPESLVNEIEPDRNLKMSSRFFPASSEWHELGKRSHWDGTQAIDRNPVAFRCYEEVDQ